MFPDNFRVMYSDCDHSLWYKTKVYTKESILEKDWTTFLKTLPDNDDINMFLIRDIWTENDYDHEFGLLGSDQDKVLWYKMGIYTKESNLVKN